MARLNWLQFNSWFQRCGALALVMLGLTCALPAQALPLFARQTGMACLACHTVYPELTHFGRMFKLNGYQLDNGKDIQMITDEGKQTAGAAGVPNLALFVMIGDVQLAKSLPDSNIAGAKIAVEWRHTNSRNSFRCCTAARSPLILARSPR